MATIDVAGSKRSPRSPERRPEAKLVRILIGSEQPLFLDGLEALLRRESELSVVARCSDNDAIVRNGLEQQPDVALLDIDISRQNNLGTVRRLNEAAPAIKVILFTARAEGDSLIEAVRLGVRGVLLKSGASSVIFQCIRQVHAGAYWLEKQMTATALSKIVRREATQRQLSRAGLTPRELEIAKLAGQGLRNVGIGAKLSISPATVKIHLHQTYRKLGLSGRIALMVYARDNDLV